MYNYDTDVLVIGGGGAGTMAAYEASKHGAKVALVLKNSLQRGGSTIMAPGAIAGVGDWKLPDDSKDVHFSDTVKGGSFLNEQQLLRRLVEDSPGLIKELEEIGALWQREENGESYSLRIDGGHSYHRCPFLEDRTGREMLRTLAGELAKRDVRVFSNVIILKVITKNNRATGAVGIDLESGEAVLLRAKAVVLACGGAGNLYLNTSNPSDITGDGFALALDAGASLMDMEFVQFFPLGFLFPRSLRGALAALMYYVHLKNSKGERFMEKYDPEWMELSTRDRVARAIFTEVKEGRGGPNGGIYADMTYHEPGYIEKMQPALFETYQKIGVEQSKDLLEVAPTCHFIMGGVRVDENWESGVRGLFAVGENAAGIHGANRLSQNALAELLVSGARAGKSAAGLASEQIQSLVAPRIGKMIKNEVDEIWEKEEGIRPVELRNRLRKVMWEKVGVFRTEKTLKEGLQEIIKLEKELGRQYLCQKSRRLNLEFTQALENRFLIKTAKAVALSALKRTESRGAHYRDDFPDKNNKEWLRHVVLFQDNGQIATTYEPVDLEELRPEEVD